MNRALSCKALTMGLRRVEAEADAIAELTEGLAPLDHDTALALIRRWLAIPLGSKPRCHYRCRIGQNWFTIGAYNASGFASWLSTYLEDSLYSELLRRQPAVAEAFRSQFLEVAAVDYAFLTEKGGPKLGLMIHDGLARGLLELAVRVFGEECRKELVS